MDVNGQKTKNLRFNCEDKKCKRAFDFLEDSCGRKKTIMISIALNELMDRYGLEGKEVKDIHTFISSYDYIHSFQQREHMSVQTNELTYPEPKPDDQSEADRREKEELQKLAALFG